MLELRLNPFPVIETERLLLRAIDVADLDALFVLRTNDDAIFHLDKEKQTRNEVAQMIERIQNDYTYNNAINWVISRPDNTSLMGLIGFWRVDKMHHRAEIGYMLHPDHWRKGYLNEAMTAVMHFGFNEMNLHSVEGHVNPSNHASIGLLEKHGFQKEAHFKENYHFRGKFRDTAIYCKIKGR
ncbi:MAG: family N-acetyltransferase [Flavipsychrobacter sp.]|jgi:ribosomal-protein-alanine N-acetyltransferase|nr:family N-acetyltransferase [Flavipsychrobacter sp.]